MLRTIPTFCNTRRCLVMAWRVSLEPRVSCEMEYGWPLESLATSVRRVSSPSAAKTGARSLWRALPALKLFLRLCDIFLDVLHLFCPTAIVLAERFGAASGGNLVEAGLGDYEKRARHGFLQAEFDQGGRLVRVIDIGIDGVRPPGERE